jgi:hypothetical protein
MIQVVLGSQMVRQSDCDRFAVAADFGYGVSIVQG